MDFYFQGRAWLNKGMSAETLAHARRHFERALALDPTNLVAVHGVALVDTFAAVAYIADDHAACLAAAESTLAKLLLLEPDNSRFHFTMGLVLVFTNRVSQGIAEYERALALDSNLAGAHAQIGNAKIRLGRPEDTEGHVLEALRLSPHDTAAFGWMQFVGSAKLSLGAIEEAIAWFRRSIEINGAYGPGHLFLATALAELGRLEEARVEAGIGLRFAPSFTIQRFRATPPGHNNPKYLKRREEIIESMRKAGVPEA
jgi:tetratricopeptide (TPR) repeat protein